MTTAKPHPAEEVLFSIADLLIEYRDRSRAAAAAPEENVATVAADPEQPEELEIEEPAPWAEYFDDDMTKKKSTSLIMSQTLHAKMQWVVNNVPRISQQKLIHAGAEAEADRLIALYHKPN